MLDERKECLFCFRTEKNTAEKIKKRCKELGKTESEYFRDLIRQDFGEMPLKQEQELFRNQKRLIYEINKIGNNINQIVHDYNSERFFDYEKKKLFALMNEVKDLLSESR